MLPEWITGLDLSDYLIMVFALGVLWFGIDYGIFSPWWRDPLGWVMLGYNISVALLLGLIIYAAVFGQRVDEIYRAPVAFLLAVSIVGKIAILHISRREGRIERRHLRRAKEGGGHGPQ